MSNSDLRKRALLLSYFTIGYIMVEFVLSIVAGILSNSIALIDSGLDSLVESLSAGFMVWGFRRGGEMSREEEARIEQKGEKLVAYAFLALAAYVFYEFVNKLVRSEIPEPSALGVVIALASMVAMPALFFAKLRTGQGASQPEPGCRCQGNTCLCLPVGGAASRIGGKPLVWLLAGGSPGRLRDSRVSG
jgi:divalent metal cation (Fe/Co/Zn/Cd) transporter